MKKRITVLLMAGLLAITFASYVSASELYEDSACNVFVSGDQASLPEDKFFSGFAAGKSVDMKDADAVGSVLMAGQDVKASDSEVSESMYVAGNNVSVEDTKVLGNVFAAGSEVSLTDGFSANAVYAAAQNFTFDGEANCLLVGAGSVTIGGVIDGDVTIDSDNITIKDGTVINGTLIVNSSKEPDIPEDVEVGKYTFNKVEPDSDSISSLSIGARILKKITSGLYWIVAMAAFGMLLCWLFDRHLSTAANYIKNRTAPMVVSGVLAWLCIPVAALLLCISYILAPIAGMLTLAYVLLLCEGLAFTGASLSRIIFPNMNVFLSALICIAALEVVRLIPVIGMLVGIAADMYLLGYVIQSLWLHRLQKSNASGEES